MDEVSIKELIQEHCTGNIIERTLKGLDNARIFGERFPKTKKIVVPGIYGYWEYRYSCTPEQVIEFAKTL